MESYYYGTIEGDIGVLMAEFKADMAFKCHLCKKVFMNNIEFMKHLSLHVENDRVWNFEKSVTEILCLMKSGARFSAVHIRFFNFFILHVLAISIQTNPCLLSKMTIFWSSLTNINMLQNPLP